MWIGIRGAASRLTFKWFLSCKSRRRWLQRVLQGYKISSPEAQESLDGQGNYLNWFTFTELHICEVFQRIFGHKTPFTKENGRPTETTFKKRTLSFFYQPVLICKPGTSSLVFPFHYLKRASAPVSFLSGPTFYHDHHDLGPIQIANRMIQYHDTSQNEAPRNNSVEL